MVESLKSQPSTVLTMELNRDHKTFIEINYKKLITKSLDIINE